MNNQISLKVLAPKHPQQSHWLVVSQCFIFACRLSLRISESKHGPILHTLHPGPSFKTNWPNKRTKETTIRQYVFSDHVFSDHDDDIRWQSPAFVFWLASNHQTSDLHHTAAVCSFPNFRIGEALKRKDVPRTASPRGRWELDIYWISTGYLN